MPRGLPLRLVVGALLLSLPLAAGARGWSAGVRERVATVAVFPVENLSGGSAPTAEIRQFLIDRLASEGFTVLDDGALEAFLTRHRVRYAAGIDAPTAESLRKEAGVDGVVIASVDLSSDAVPPKLGLFMRLVSVTGAPTVIWAGDAGVAGDDYPGMFCRGVINDYQILQTRTLTRLADSLLAYLKSGESGADAKPASKFRPKASFRSFTLEPDRSYSVVVAPFFNMSERRYGGEILALLYMRHLASVPQFRVIDAGVVRRQLLDDRIIMDGGLSVGDAETVASHIGADLVLAGRVLRYEDYEGAAGRAAVEFSTALIETKSRRVVWSSDSYNEGSDGVRFFERGASRTAHAMATQMVRLTAEMIAGRDR